MVVDSTVVSILRPSFSKSAVVAMFWHQAIKSNITHSILLKHALNAYRKMFHHCEASREEDVTNVQSLHADSPVQMDSLPHAVSVALDGGIVHNW